MMCKILPGRKREVLAFGCTFFFPVTRSVLGSGAAASVGSSSCGDVCSKGNMHGGNNNLPIMCLRKITSGRTNGLCLLSDCQLSFWECHPRGVLILGMHTHSFLQLLVTSYECPTNLAV